nr:MAG TPA_asm: hypothetical protein [Caudoviricetes sp.]
MISTAFRYRATLFRCGITVRLSRYLSDNWALIEH